MGSGSWAGDSWGEIDAARTLLKIKNFSYQSPAQEGFEPMEWPDLKEQSWRSDALSRLGFCGANPTHCHLPSFWRRAAQIHPNPHIPTRPILALSQADLSLTSALFYGLDSLFSLKSSPSFQAALQPGRRENIQTTQQMTQHSLSPHSSSNANNPQPAPAVGFKICN